MNLESLLVLCQFLLSLVLVMSFHLFGKNQCFSSLFSVFARKLHTTLTFLMVYQLPPMQETTRKLKKKKKLCITTIIIVIIPQQSIDYIQIHN